MRTARFLLSAALLICAFSVAAASDAWQPMSERRDFKVDDRATVLERAYAELRDVYGALDAEGLKNAKSYVHSIRSREYKADILVVMIEDLSAGEPDCYYEVVFELPEMSGVSVGGIWLDGTAEDYLKGVPARVYSEPEAYSDDVGVTE